MGKLLLISILLGLSSQTFAQDEMSQEIDKLSTGQVETKKSVVPQDPTQSADDVERELNKEMISNSRPARQEAPAPEEIAPPAPQEIAEPAAPIETAPLDLPAEPLEKKAQKTIDPDETLQPVQEQIVEKPKKQKPAALPKRHEVAPIEVAPEESAPAPEAAVAQAPTNQDVSPDDYAQRLNRIYNKFYSEGTSDTAWTQIAGEKINENYTVQPGDTLWDISVTFFGNGHYWPKVWQMNDDITNPHVVTPGYVLRFTPGKMDSAPQMNLSANGDVAPAPSVAKSLNLAQNDTSTTSALVVAPVIPPPDHKSTPVLKNLPNSLPYISGPKAAGFDADGFSFEKEAPTVDDAKVFLSSYLSEDEPEHIGKVVETDDEDITQASLYDNVYVRFDDPIHVGDRYLTYHLGDNIHSFGGDSMGKPVILEGEIQVTELVNKEKNVYKAKVLRNVNFVSAMSYVMKGKLIEGTTALTGSSANLSAEIVGGEFDNTRKYTATEEVVYLSKGSEAGIKEGQIFEVYKNMEARKSSTYVRDLKDKVARIKIIKTTATRATAIVIGASQEVMVGDFTGVKENARNDEIKDLDFDASGSVSESNVDDDITPDTSSNSDKKMDSDQVTPADDDLIQE